MYYHNSFTDKFSNKSKNIHSEDNVTYLINKDNTEVMKIWDISLEDPYLEDKI